MSVQCQILTQEDKQKVHAESIRILQEVGVKFLSDKALKILKENGAKVNNDTKIAKIPEEMVQQALKTAPKTFVLGSRLPENDFHLPSSYSGYVLDNGGIFTRDFKTGERRRCNYQDHIDFLRVFDEMKLASAIWPASVSEFPKQSANLREDISSFMYSTRHVQDELGHPAEVPYMVEAMTAILGSEDAVKQRHLYSVVYCTLAPLVHEGKMCDAYLELIQVDAPICLLPMPCAGSTGPASLFSNIAMGNAEALSGLTLYQMARPGTPIIYGDASGNTNFSTGGFVEGSPEMVLQAGARGEMAKFYNLPDTQAGCLTDAKDHGPQAIMEKLITTLPLVMLGVDLVQGPGALETSNMMTLEQIVVDDEIACLCKRLKDGVDMSDAKNYFEDIRQVKPGGHFLDQANTLQACRSSEFIMPQLCDRNTFDQWVELGRPDLYDKAKEKVEEILAGPPKNPLPDDVIAKLEDIMRRADEELE
ncbi:trimethylamine methyltransferase family protein [Desulfococcaceae bacterium HSG9]|nr:trimethylamine methyltransferase family protein [Desulfococcaceae bacterium HSG9]